MKPNTMIRRSFAAALIGLSAFSLAACGGKPSESEVKAKLMESYDPAEGLSKEQAEKFADCMAPKLVDTVSEEGLNKLMDISAADITDDDVSEISKADQEAVGKAAGSCANVLMGS